MPPYAVVIPSYNCARYLTRCVRAIAAQDLAPADIVVVDDGGSDDPAAALAGLPARLVRHDRNRGLSQARNTGFDATTADLIALCDADDEWLPGKMAAQLALLEAAPKLTFAYADFAHRLPDGSPTDWQGGLVARHRAWGVPLESVPGVEGGHAHGPGLAHWLLAKTSFCHPSTVVIRRKAWAKTGGFATDYKSAEDLELWVRLAELGPAGVADRVTVQVEQRPESLGHNTVKLAEHMLKIYAAARGRHPALPAWVRREIDARTAQFHADLGYHYRRVGDGKLARAHLRQALAAAPSARNRLALLKGYVLPTMSR